MAATVTWETLRELSRFRSTTGCAISLYVGLDPSEVPTSTQVNTKFRALVDEAAKLADAHEGSRECRLQLRADVERIREWLEDEFDRDGARGIAVFAASGDGLFRVMPLAEPVRDGVQIDAELYLAPLSSLVGYGDGVLVAVVSRERGVVYRLSDAKLVEVADESEEQPGRHDQGGWSQARYQRHIEHLVQQHLKTVGGELAKRARRVPDLQIVVVAPEETRPELEAQLSHDVRDAIAGWTSADAHATPTELLELVRPIIDEAEARRKQEALERWEQDRGRGTHAAAGWRDTLEAACDARVDTLLLEEGADRPAWQCPKDGRAYSEAGECPLDGAVLEPREHGVDLALHHVLRHGGSFVILGAGALADADGIGALLRF
jgi:peptide chain release factor subunit 1